MTKIKCNSTKTGLKEFTSITKTKSPKCTYNGVLAKPSKKFTKQKYPNKLSTLDNWLRELYQPQLLKREAILTETEPTNKTNENALDRPARLYVRLQKVNLVQLKDSINELKSNENVSVNNGCNVIKAKRKGSGYTDRMSEYIKLGSKEYKCAKCDFTHCTQLSMRIHFDKEHNEKMFECKLCPFKTRQQYYFNAHVKYHSKPDLECPHCKKMIKSFSYKTHIKTHERNNKSEYKCSFCEYQSYNHSNVKRHELSRHKNPHELQTFSCESCDYVTILEERLKQHKKMVHSKEGVWLTCPQCEYTTRNKFHMARHVNDLHKEKTIRCDECSQLFSNKDNLRYHKHRMHADLSTKKYYYCELCPKEEQYKTSEKGNLARHILAHRRLDEIEVFACHKCSYLGKSKNALKTHLINAHLPEMHNFKCKLCGHSTNIKSRYDNHVREVHGKSKSAKYKRSQKNDDAEGLDNTTRNVSVDYEEPINMDIKEETDSFREGVEDNENVDVGGTQELNLTEFWSKQENYQY